MLGYQISPVKMKGTIKKLIGDDIKIYLHGRLGVIIVNKSLVMQDIELEPGHVVEFYFSYVQQNLNPYDYDIADIYSDNPMGPVFCGGTVIESNDTAIKVQIMDNLGTIAVPRRWVVSDSLPEVGQNVEFYFGRMDVVGKRDIPAEFI